MPYAPAGRCLFQSGFEPEARGLPEDAHEIFAGVDLSVEPAGDWDALRRHLPSTHPWAESGAVPARLPGDEPHLGYLDIQYLGGTVAERYARIVEDPTEPGNHVLHFWLHHPNEVFANGKGRKARVQAALYGNRGLRALCSTVRMYLHPDLDALRDWDAGFDWLTLQEYWFAPGWEGGKHPFRISLGLCHDPGAGRDLHFTVHGQPACAPGEPHQHGAPGWAVPTWSFVGRDLAVPTGIWLECRTCYRMGDAATGRFVYQVRRAGGEWLTLFDITDWTYNPRSPQPLPLWGWNPMKLYTSSALIERVRERGGTAQIYWDDFAVYSDWSAS